MTTYRGKIEAGKIVLKDMPRFPDGTEVEVTLTQLSPSNGPASPASPAPADDEDDPIFHIADRAVKTGIPDLAAEHDHYAYGTPKRRDQKPQ
ncbi:MAG TPA: hypothetical protein VD997_09365 [Phycisphaerales bacterium]|nr:hypothetical protein [Phycisphaerales bacterium]